MVTLRAMVEADLGRVAAIECETLSPWSARSIAQELEMRQAIQIVAETSAKQIVGWCACRIIWPEAELLKIAVEKKNRRLGVGHLLLELLFDKLQKKKVTNMFLEVRSNNRAALDFYERHGFIEIGVRANYYNDPPDTAMILKKEL